MIDTCHNTILLGFTVSDELLQPVLDSDSVLPTQTHRFAWSLARALTQSGCRVRLLSAVPASNYPSMPKTWFRSTRFESRGLEGCTLGYINLLGLKHVTRFLSCLTTGRRWIRAHNTSVIVVHGVHSPFLLFAVCMRRRTRKVIVVMTDPPGAALSSDGKLVRWLRRIDTQLARLALTRVDGVIALTQSLIDDYASGRRGLVLQGFVDPELVVLAAAKDSARAPPRRAGQPFSIAYAGGLYSKYGVDLLVDAVCQIHDPSVRLEVFGKGDLEGRIRALAKVDSRIYYGGALRPEELYCHLRKADLLVNPRPTHESFVRYSFPSKLIEYMALGVPVLSTRLPGIPTDYFEHLLTIEEETADGLQQSLIAAISTPADMLDKLAAGAQCFVLATASEMFQGRRIARFLRETL